jgi:hypothetical protein
MVRYVLALGPLSQPVRTVLSREHSEAIGRDRIVVTDLGSADDATKRLAAVMLLVADEVDKLAGVVGRLSRQVAYGASPS